MALQVSDCSFLRGKSHFKDDGTQDYLMFQPVHKYLKKNF